MTTTGDVELLCNGHGSPYRPQGLPPSYSWYPANKPPMDGNNACPSGWSSGTGYFVVYPEDLAAEGKPSEPWVGGFMFIKDCVTQLHRRDSNVWDTVQNSAQAPYAIACARMIGTQSGNTGYALQCPKQSDGSFKIELPPLSYCNHGWPNARASFNPNVYDHAFHSFKIKLDNPNSDMLVQAGFDWWQSPSAPFPNNRGSGCCAWVRINGTEWTEASVTQMLLSAFEATPPPGVVKGAAGGGGTDPIPPDPVPTEGGIEISVDGNILGKGSMVTFKVR